MKPPVRIVAEAGTSHGGSRSRASELIRAAAGSGADAIKFQHFYADEIIHPNSGLVELPGGSVELYQRFRELETGPDFIEYLKKECLSNNISFFCSPFGERSARELLDLGERSLKIASPELNHFPLLRMLCQSNICELVLSTGVSTLDDIAESVEFIQDQNGELELSLLHCITAYPAPEDEFNLAVIPQLSEHFSVQVGLSDHSLDPQIVPSLAVLAGAHMVEKHFTLDRNAGGLDDPIALEPEDFTQMTRAIRSSEKIRSSGNNPDAVTAVTAGPGGPDDRSVGNGASSPERILSYAAEHPSLAAVPPRRLESILGNGIKTLADSEAGNYAGTRRSIHVISDMHAGERIREADLAVLRSEKNLKPGLHPRHLMDLPGKVLIRDIPAGEGINFADISGM